MIRLKNYIGGDRWMYCSQALPATAAKWCFCRPSAENERRLEHLILTPQRGEALVRAQEAVIRDEMCDTELSGRRLMLDGHLHTVGSFWYRRGTRLFWLIPDSEDVLIRAVPEGRLRSLLRRPEHGA